MSVEYVSEYLPPGEMRRVYDDLAIFVGEVAGESIVTVMYGALSGIHTDLWYKPMAVGPSWFGRFLRESEEKRIIGPAESDLVLVFRDGEEITFCHEGDIHVRSDSAERLEQFIAAPSFTRLVGSVSFARRG